MKLFIPTVVLMLVIGLSYGQEHAQKTTRENPPKHPEKQLQEHPAEQPQEQPQEDLEKAAGEHPQEHPEKAAGEHPEEESAAVLTKETLAAAVERYVQDNSKGSYGFKVVDDKTGKTLALKLVKVHQERLAALGNDTYFACADFVTEQGKVYDLDVFMTGKGVKNLKFSTCSVHKEAGVERYTWMEKKGLWVKVPREKEVIE